MRFRTILVVLAAVTGCSAPVQHGLDETSANEVVSALERAGLGAEKVREESTTGNTFVVRVARGDAVRALETLRALGLPRRHGKGFAEVYAQPSLVPTATEERARYVEALAGEIERTLETVDGVVNARVHLVLAETDPLAGDGKPRVPAQAAVLLKVRPGAPPLQEADAQKLVAGSVPGLAHNAVAVVLTQAPECPTAGSSPALAALGPLRVTPGTRPILLLGLGGAMVVLVLLALLLLLTARRLAAIERELAGRAGSDLPAAGTAGRGLR